MKDINGILPDLITWEQNHNDITFLREVLSESTPSLRTRYWQLKKLGKDNSKWKYITPSTFKNFHDALRHELRKRKIYWPILNLFFRIKAWWFLIFRNKLVFESTFGFMTTAASMTQWKWRHKSIGEHLESMMSFLIKHKELIKTICIILTFFLTLITTFRTCYPHSKNQTTSKSHTNQTQQIKP